MLKLDFFFLLIFLIQPVIIIIIIYMSIFKINNSSNSYIYNIRKKNNNLNYFECSSYSKNKFIISYDIFIICLATLFIIYDVDLIFFLTQTLNIQKISLFEFYIISMHICIMLLGLYFEYVLYNYIWN